MVAIQACDGARRKSTMRSMGVDQSRSPFGDGMRSRSPGARLGTYRGRVCSSRRFIRRVTAFRASWGSAPSRSRQNCAIIASRMGANRTSSMLTPDPTAAAISNAMASTSAASTARGSGRPVRFCSARQLRARAAPSRFCAAVRAVPFSSWARRRVMIRRYGEPMHTTSRRRGTRRDGGAAAPRHVEQSRSGLDNARLDRRGSVFCHVDECNPPILKNSRP